MKNCWFCDTNLATHDFKVLLSKEVGRTGDVFETTVHEQNVTIQIPRCDLCGSVHQFRSKLKIISIIALYLNLPFMIFTFLNLKDFFINLQLPRFFETLLIILVAISPILIIYTYIMINRKKIELKKWPQLATIDKVKSYTTGYLEQYPAVSMYVMNKYIIYNSGLKENKFKTTVIRQKK